MEVDAEYRTLVISYDFLYAMGGAADADGRYKGAHDAGERGGRVQSSSNVFL